jgi:hypothetical protein
MVAVAVWYLTNFFRRDDDPPRSPEPTGNIHDYLTTALLDPRWRAHRNSMRRSVETVLRAGAKDKRIVATLWVRFQTTLGGLSESVVLDTADYTIELEAKLGFLWPWQLNPASKTYSVTFDGEALGTVEVGREQAIARDASGDVARWLTGTHPPMQPYEGTTPYYGQLVGKVSGSLRVPLRRLHAPTDFNDAPFFAEADGDARWLPVFLAIAAANSLAMQARATDGPRPINS